MTSVLKELAGSKKFLVTLVSLIVAGAARLGLHLDGDSILAFLGTVSAWLVSQGVADSGKAAAVVNYKTAQLRMASLSTLTIPPLREPEKGSVSAPILAVVACVGVLAMACATAGKDVKTGATAFGSCAKADLGRIVGTNGKTLLGDVAALIQGNVSSLESDLSALALTAGYDSVACSIAAVEAVLESNAGSGAKTSQPLPGLLRADAWRDSQK